MSSRPCTSITSSTSTSAASQALVNAIGCVYADVDHRYYNNTALTDYSSIDIQPGYQKLCGAAALAFVRFRHPDSDLVRNARQQDFIRWAKDQYGVQQASSPTRDRLLKIFGAHTQTDRDLHSIDGLINLFNLVAFSAGHTIRQIRFPAHPALQRGGRRWRTPCFVTADPGPEAGLSPPSSPHGRGDGGGRSQRLRAGPGMRSGQAWTTNLIADLADGRAQAAALGSSRNADPVPAADRHRLDPLPGSGRGPSVPAQVRPARPERGPPHAAYRMVLALNGGLGQYYGVQGTTWQHPPLLAVAAGDQAS